MYIDYSKPPFVDVTLPPAIELPIDQLLLFYSAIILLDFALLYKSQISRQIISPIIIAYHIAIPLIFNTKYPQFGPFLVCVPGFIACYSIQLPASTTNFKVWMKALLNIVTDPNHSYTQTQCRTKGAAKVCLGIFKICFSIAAIKPLLPNHFDDALNYAWTSPANIYYTFLFGVNSYCMMGVIDIGLGLLQLISGLNVISLFNSPILSTSPRDFWSRRWNKIIHNMLRSHVFLKENQTVEDTPIVSTEISDKKKSNKKRSTSKVVAPTNKRITRSAAKKNEVIKSSENVEKKEGPVKNDKAIDVVFIPPNNHIPSRRWKGLLTFAVSGAFHELIVMGTCRKITLESFAFFLIQGLLVMIEIDLRQGALKQEPTGKNRFFCILLHLLSLSFFGRLFLAPLIRYHVIS